MARVSRKAAVMEQEAGIISKPERVYSTAVYARLSVEDNNRAGDRESITMQRYMLEKYVEARPICVLAAYSVITAKQGQILNARNSSA